jgi:hypothetical protein
MAKQEVDEHKPKKLGFLHGDIKTPPFSEKARKESGYRSIAVEPRAA